MQPIPQDLPGPLRDLLSTFPIVEGKFYILVYDRDGIIRYISNNLLTLPLNLTPSSIDPLYGKNVRDILLPAFSDKSTPEFSEMLFKDSLSSLHVNVALWKFSDDPIVSYLWDAPSILALRRIGDYYVASVYKQLLFLEKILGAETQDIVALIDENDEIKMFSEDFWSKAKPRLSDGKLLMHHLTPPESWFRLLNRERDVNAYTAKCRENAAPWKEVFAFSTFDSKSWIPWNAEEWNTGAGCLTSLKKEGNAFITCLQELDQTGNDIRIDLEADLGSWDPQGTVGAVFHTDFANISSELTRPDARGYTLSVRRDWELNMKFSIRLKKQGSAFRKSELESPPFPVLAEKPAGWQALSFEKTGGAFVFGCCGREYPALNDPAPLHVPDNNYFGLIASHGVVIRNVRVCVRPTVFDYRKIPPEVVDLVFNKAPDRIYETRIGESTLPRFKFRYVYMKEVTYSRSLLDKLNANLKGIEQELDTAKKIETVLSNVLIPRHEGIRFSYCHKSSRQVGGDLLDIKDLGKRRYAVLIYDVSGHGIAASLVSSMAKMSFENSFKQTQSPAVILELVNRDICIVADASMFITAFLCVIDMEKGELTYARAGHCPPAIFSKSRTAPELLKEGSPLLGNRPDFEYENYVVKLHPGDRLFMYTDGLLEARDSREELFGRKRLFDLLGSTLGKTADEAKFAIIKEMEAFAGSGVFDDDLTFILSDIL